MTLFRILPEASEELEASIHYYESQQAGLGVAFLLEFKRTRERIEELPNARREWTHAWWDDHLGDYDVYTSEAVIEELEGGLSLWERGCP